MILQLVLSHLWSWVHAWITAFKFHLATDFIAFVSSGVQQSTYLTFMPAFCNFYLENRTPKHKVGNLQSWEDTDTDSL